MAETSGISWTDATFNPWRGCTKVSPECDRCYAETMSGRNPSVLGIWGNEGTRVVAAESYWQTPLKWNAKAAREGKRLRVFCCSLADVFEEWPGEMRSASLVKVGDDSHFGDCAMGVCHGCGKWMHSQLDPDCGGSDEKCSRVARPLTMDDCRRRLFALIDATPNLDWMLLTKRPENIRRMWPSADVFDKGSEHKAYWPNVWLGTTAGLQETADRNLPHLINCRDLSPVLWLSAEPLLGPVTLQHDFDGTLVRNWLGEGGLTWVITGGESGHGARPCNPRWVRDLRDECNAAGVAFHHKQHGEWAPTPHGDWADKDRHWFQDGPSDDDGVSVWRVGKKVAGRTLDGKVWDEFPAVTQ